MKRKVVLHGATTLIVSLPIAWVKKYNVKKGDSLNVIEDGTTLLMAPGEMAFKENRQMVLRKYFLDHCSEFEKHFQEWLLEIENGFKRTDGSTIIYEPNFDLDFITVPTIDKRGNDGKI